jgi:hypothetical protein
MKKIIFSIEIMISKHNYQSTSIYLLSTNENISRVNTMLENEACLPNKEIMTEINS